MHLFSASAHCMHVQSRSVAGSLIKWHPSTPSVRFGSHLESLSESLITCCGVTQRLAAKRLVTSQEQLCSVTDLASTERPVVKTCATLLPGALCWLQTCSQGRLLAWLPGCMLCAHAGSAGSFTTATVTTANLQRVGCHREVLLHARTAIQHSSYANSPSEQCKEMH
jgi:hypothetical protein